MLLLKSSLKEGYVHLVLLDRFVSFFGFVIEICIENIHFVNVSFSCTSLQKVPEKTKESAGAPWQFVGLLSVFDPPRHDSAETIRRALNLGVNVKMITGN